MFDLSSHKISYTSLVQLWEIGGTKLLPFSENRAMKIDWIIIGQLCWNVLAKLGGVRSLTSEKHRLVNLASVSRILLNNSAADCSISLKFSAEFNHVTTDTLQVFKV